MSSKFEFPAKNLKFQLSMTSPPLILMAVTIQILEEKTLESHIDVMHSSSYVFILPLRLREGRCPDLLSNCLGTFHGSTVTKITPLIHHNKKLLFRCGYKSIRPYLTQRSPVKLDRRPPLHLLKAFGSRMSGTFVFLEMLPRVYGHENHTTYSP